MSNRRRKPILAASLALLALAPITLFFASCSRPAAEETARPRAARMVPPAPARGAVPAIEILPQDRAYFFGVRGAAQPRQLVLTSHLARPLAILRAESDNPLFHGEVTPLSPGRRFRLTVTLDPRAPAGRHEGVLRLTTDDPAHPVVEVPVRAALDEPVYASPGRIYFGTLRTADLGDQAVARREILVRRLKGSGFKVLGAASDVPFLDLTVTPQKAAQEGESWRVSVRIVRERAVKGKLQGTVTVRTNDPAFPELRLPVSGTLL